MATLLSRHREALDRLRHSLSDVLGPSHDDLFLLRYLLSFDPAAAAEAVRWAIAWRAEPANLYWLQKAEEKEARMMAMNFDPSKVAAINISAYHKGLKDGGPLQIVRPGLVDFGPMLELHDHERMVMFHVMQKEVAWRMCDRRTRETGRLVKLVVINDFTALRMSMPPKKVMESYSASSKLAERLYPQMLQTTVCINVPTWFSMVIKVGKLFMSAKTLEKFKICPKSGRIEDCPFVRKYLNLADVPTFLGGPCTCAHQGGCVPGLSNDAKVVRTLTKAEVEKLKSDTVREGKEEREKIAAFVAKMKADAAHHSTPI